MERSQTWLESEHPNEALSDLDQLPPSHAASPAAAFLRARILVALRRPEEALTILERGLQTDDASAPTVQNNPDAHLLHAELLDQMRRPREAATALATAIAKGADEVAAIAYRARVLWDWGKGDRAAAMHLLRESLVQHPGNGELTGTLGLLAYDAQDLDLAERMLESAVKPPWDPIEGAAWLYLARIALDRDDMNAAHIAHDRSVGHLRRFRPKPRARAELIRVIHQFRDELKRRATKADPDRP